MRGVQGTTSWRHDLVWLSKDQRWTATLDRLSAVPEEELTTSRISPFLHKREYIIIPRTEQCSKYQSSPSGCPIVMLTMKALVTTEGRSATVQDIEIPKPGEGEILVKVHYCAQNPTDWKAVTIVPPGRIIGCDFAGTVVDSNGSSWREGHHVAGFVHGTADHPTRGVFAEYAVIEKSLVYRIPDDITFQQAAAIPVAFATAVQAMFQRLKMPEPPQVAKGRRPFLANGGASSVGQYAIQLGKLAGLFVIVIATGSKKNHELLISLGD